MSLKSFADAHAKSHKGGGRSSRTPEKKNGGAKKSSPGEFNFRQLAPNELGSVIFGCTNSTMDECLSKNLFGLPSRHMVYVQNIRKGMNLFLFNYTDRKMHGIYEAISDGEKNIDTTAWPSHSMGQTMFPAQVSVCIRQQCNPLSENLYKTVIKDNYYAATHGQNNHFMFELDHQQTSKLITLFTGLPPPPAINKFPVTEALSPLSPSNASMVPDQGKNVQIYRQIQFSDDDFKCQDYSGNRQFPHDELKQKVESYLPSAINDAETVDNYYEDPCISYSGPCGDLLPEQHALGEISSVFLPNTNLSSDRGTLCKKMDLQRFNVVYASSVEGALEDANSKFPKKEAVCHSPGSRKQNKNNQFQNEKPFHEYKSQTRKSNGSNQDTDVAVKGSEQKVYEEETDQSGNLQYFLSSLSEIRKESSELKEMINEARIEQHREFQTANTLLHLLEMKMSSEISSLRMDVAQLQEQLRKLCPQEEEPNAGKGYETSYSVNMDTSGSNIYIIGGCDGDQWFQSMDIFCPEVNEIKPAPSIHNNRPCHAASAFDGYIYVFGGGYGKSLYDSVEVYDQRNNQWSPCTSMSSKRSCLAGASISQGIIALGGENEQGSLSDVEFYDACTGKWMEHRKMVEKDC